MTTPGPVVIEPARPMDAAAIARLHAEGISEGFLSSLGASFLMKLYRGMAGSPDATVLVARRENRVVGFVAGAAAPGHFYRAFLRRNAFGATASAAANLWKPAVALRAFETLRHIRRSVDAPSAELLAIAVSPGVRRAGIGAELVAHLEEALIALGGTAVAVVVGAGNTGARAFYERLGFAEPVTLEVHRGSASVRYTKPLTPPPAA